MPNDSAAREIEPVDNDLKKAHDQLEAEVEKRTEQLSKANAALEEQIKEGEQAALALRESEERFRVVFESAAVGMALIKPHPSLKVGPWDKYFRVNRSFCKMLGYSEQELLRKPLGSLIQPDDLKMGLEQTRRVIVGKMDSFRLEKRYIHKKGHIVWILTATSLIRDDSGNPLYFVSEIHDVTESKCAEEKLRKSHEELRRLSAHLESAREEERAQIAREIHDDLGQSLTALKLDLAWMEGELGPDQKSLSKHARGMLRLVDQTIKSLRRILSALRPAILDDLGLAAAIEWQAQEFQERTHIVCKLDCKASCLDLDATRSTAVFRIFQETLTNVARHAEAREIHVVLKEEGENLILRVRDDGKGIVEADMSDANRFGIAGMRERALLVGGQVRIEGIPGRGTEVQVEIPLNQEG